MIFDPAIINELYYSSSEDEDYSDSDSSCGSEDDVDNDDDEKKEVNRSTNAYYSHDDRLDSHIYKTYLSHKAEMQGVHDQHSHVGKKFRQKFRVPYSTFLQICIDIRSAGYVEKRQVTGEPAVPLKLLILACLRIIASGCPFDIAEDLSHVGQETIRNFFWRHFCMWGLRKSKTVIRMPCTEEDFRSVIGLYERIGYPGCAGSIDCVHVVWDRCPADMFHSCTGKDGNTTLAFECVCDHQKRILHVSQAFWGCTNDKNIARVDEVFDMLQGSGSHAGHPLSTMEWTCVDEHGKQIRNHGAWLLCDGGYHEWPCLACPCKQQPAGPIGNWSTSVESTRKDIECVFGILKKRFLILKNPIRQQIKQNIERMFLTCCVLHNMTMDDEGLHDWMIDEDDEEVYDPLAKLVERNLRKKKASEKSGSGWDAQFEQRALQYQK